MKEEEEFIVWASNEMIHHLPPEELERFAALEQEMSSLKAEMQALYQAVRDRKLTDWQELTDAEELAFLEQLPADGRAFLEHFPADERAAILQMDREEFVQLKALGRRRAAARLKHAEIMRAHADDL
jgi:hypothetical protein